MWKKFPVKITSEVVKKVLTDCSSDIMALNLFIWFGNRPGYKHTPDACTHIAETLNKLISGCGTAHGVLGQLRDIGCPINTQTVTVLLRIYSHAGMVEEALDTFNQIPSYGCIPNILAQNAILDILFKSNRVDMASSMFGSIPSPNFFHVHHCCQWALQSGESM